MTPRTPFLGYAGRPELSEQKLLRGVFAQDDTFFSTGDLVEEDGDGFVRFCDRTGDTFRSAQPAEPRPVGSRVIWDQFKAIWDQFMAIWDPGLYGINSWPYGINSWPYGIRGDMGSRVIWDQFMAIWDQFMAIWDPW